MQIGKNQTLSETLTNSGGSSVSITQAAVTGSGFSVAGLSLPLTLAGGQSVTFGAAFAPQSAGTASGNISVVSNASDSILTIPLSGSATAAGQLALTPATMDFGSIVVGTSKHLTGTLSATGSSVTVSSATVTSSEFVLSGLSFPFTIAAGQSTPFTLTFIPQASGTASASASFASNASPSPAVESLTGSGTAALQHKRQSFVESQHFRGCGLQRIPQRQIGRTLHENQFSPGCRHHLYRQLCASRTDIFLCHYIS